jgi:chromodomain-helicase-DNA-binding protein 7
MLFSDVRTKLLPIEKFEKKFKHCHKSAYLPDWWIPGKHDRGLVEGIDKHGLEYEDICSDTTLPFIEVFKQKLEKVLQTLLIKFNNTLRIKKEQNVRKKNN